MPKNKKSTVTVTCSWFSSDPVFKEVFEAIKLELFDPKILTPDAISILEDLYSFNGGEPFRGHTDFGPHTTISFEALSLAKGVLAARVLEDFLRHEFPKKGSFGHFMGGIQVYYAGMSLIKAIEMLETALAEAQQDLKGTRRFLPSKQIQRLRLVFEELHR